MYTIVTKLLSTFAEHLGVTWHSTTVLPYLVARKTISMMTLHWSGQHSYLGTTWM